MNDTAYAASLVGCTFEGDFGLSGALFTVLSADGPLVHVVDTDGQRTFIRAVLMRGMVRVA